MLSAYEITAVLSLTFGGAVPPPEPADPKNLFAKVIQRSIDAEKKLDFSRLRIEREEFVTRLPGSRENQQAPGASLDKALRLKTEDALAGAHAATKIVYRLTTPDPESKLSSCATPEIISVETAPTPQVQSNTQNSGSRPPPPVQMFTVTAQALFGRLNPMKTSISIITESETTVQLRVENADFRFAAPVHLAATFDKNTGLLLKSELFAKDIPIVSATFEYEKNVRQFLTLKKRTIRVNEPDRVIVCVETTTEE